MRNSEPDLDNIIEYVRGLSKFEHESRKLAPKVPTQLRPGSTADELKPLSPCSRKLIDDLPDENIASLLNHYQQNHPVLFDTMVQLSLVHVRINQLEEYIFWCDPMDVR